MRPDDATRNNAAHSNHANVKANIPKIQTANRLTPSGKLSTITPMLPGRPRVKSGSKIRFQFRRQFQVAHG